MVINACEGNETELIQRWYRDVVAQLDKSSSLKGKFEENISCLQLFNRIPLRQPQLFHGVYWDPKCSAEVRRDDTDAKQKVRKFNSCLLMSRKLTVHITFALDVPLGLITVSSGRVPSNQLVAEPMLDRARWQAAGVGGRGGLRVQLLQP